MTNNDKAMRMLPAIPGLSWTEARSTAVMLAEHGWPVLPGTYQLAEHAGWLGKPRAMGLEPVADLWCTASTRDPAVALEWWTRRPYSVLLLCGAEVDAMEVPIDHANRALPMLRSRGQLSPIAVTPFRTSLIFVPAGHTLREEFDKSSQVRLHSSGAWVPLPPTCRDGVQYRWEVLPADVGWQVADSSAVQQALLETLDVRSAEAAATARSVKS
ncbi:bifunctional DNA primase/polymerase [Prauserella flavalba]|uniref:bifunctional DNA primase/polymerase n=1 Tax=Prauserella flavalba TaxID=1477506 RepID=UPI0036ECAD16